MKKFVTDFAKGALFSILYVALFSAVLFVFWTVPAIINDAYGINVVRVYIILLLSVVGGFLYALFQD